MRCLSPHERYSIQVIEAEEQIVMDARGFAQSHVLKKPVIANFDKTGILDHEIEAALTYLNFTGLPEGVSPLSTISVFDTEFYCEANFPADRRDEMQVQIDNRLRELQPKNPGEFIIIEPPVKPKPWPSYDDYGVEDILRFQEALRINPETIRLYELENQNRSELIEEMKRLEDPEYDAKQAAAEAEGGEIPVQA